MADIKVSWDNNTGEGDIAFGVDDLLKDNGLETCVLISLFTDARVNGERGFWASSVEGAEWGSKLWTLQREKLTEKTRIRYEQYCRDALQWMLSDSIARSVNVISEINISNPNRLDLRIEITRPDEKIESFRFKQIWEAQTGN